MVRVRSQYLITVALSLLVGAMTITVLVPSRPLTVDEEGEERGETFGTDAVRYRLMKLTDRFGRMPANAYTKAKAQVNLLKWGGLARRLESAPAPPLDPQMFTATSPAAALPAAAAVVNAISPESWRWLGPGNIGGRIRSLVINPASPNTMFAGGVGGGIWKTTNGGASWSPLDDFMAVLSVASLAINPVTPSVMYAGTGEGYLNGDSIRGDGIFKSTDSGTTWTQLPSTANSSFRQVNRLAVSPNGGVLLAATRSGLFRSTNAGVSFTPVAVSEAADVDFHPTNGLKAIASGWGSVSYSVDGGVTWQGATGVPGGAGRIEIAYARSQPDVIYASADLDGGSMLRSGNGGATFSVVSQGAALLDRQGWYDNALWVSPIDSNHMIVGGVFLRQSVDGGTTWSGLDAFIHVDHHVIVSHPRYDGIANRQVFFAGDGGVNTADDLSTVSTFGFRSLNNNLGVTQFYGGAANPSTGVIVGGTQDHGTLVWTPASGTSWVQTLGSDGGFAAADPTDPNYFYSETVYLGLYRSSNGGFGWNAMASGIADAGRSANFIAPFILDPNNPNRMLAGGASLWRSNNVKAVSPAWTAIQGSATDNVSAIAVAPGNSDVLWVGRSYGRIYKSTNATAATPAFIALSVPTGGMITRITIDPFDANVVYVTTGGFAPANILRTTDGGATWSDATGSGTTALPEVPVNDVEIDLASPGTIYAATEVGVFVSLDAGAHWELPQDGPANVCVDELFWMGSTLVAATHGRGMFAVETRPAGSPAVSVSSATIDFGTQTIGTLGTRRRVTLTNTGTAPLTFNSSALSGANPGDWPQLTQTCTGTIAAGGTCWLEAAFQPRASGTRTADIVVTSNASTSPTLVHLRGVGAALTSSVPAPWVSQDIGATGVAGSASLANAVFTVNGRGADVYGTSDAFHFVFQTVSGDATIVARVADIVNGSAWTKAGLMIRSDAAAGAANAALFVTPSNGSTFQRRAAAGSTTTSIAAAATVPRWLKLARAGAAVTASASADGTTWTTIGQGTVALGSSMMIGLAVTSHDTSKSATATLDHVSITASTVTPALPSGWTTQDIGAAGQAGSATETGGVFTVKSAGADIWGTADAFRYAYVPLAGDGSIVARVATVQNGDGWTKAGIMIRQTVDPGSVHASMLVTPGNGLVFVGRTAAGGVSTRIAATGAAPRWVRLARAGQLFTASVSVDGTVWTAVGQGTIAMTGTVWAGLALSGHVTTQVATATMDSVAVSAAPVLAAGWQSSDIGSVGVKGSASSSDSTFVVSGAGADIWGATDAFQFAYKTLTGDGQIVARMASVENTHRWAKAGVMVRAGLTGNAPYAMMLVSAAAGTSFQSRTAAGGVSTSVSGDTSIVAPEWVKIVRAGNVLNGYQSKDGVIWTSVGGVAIEMSGSVTIGLAVTSHDSTRLSKATFESVAVK
jgi:regulation of enolase protein 1 (concanavalin A-like superfamily)